jgi:hypothetical protein
VNGDADNASGGAARQLGVRMRVGGLNSSEHQDEGHASQCYKALAGLQPAFELTIHSRLYEGPRNLSAAFGFNYLEAAA